LVIPAAAGLTCEEEKFDRRDTSVALRRGTVSVARVIIPAARGEKKRDCNPHTVRSAGPDTMKSLEQVVDSRLPPG
jgi:hypothetical protein